MPFTKYFLLLVVVSVVIGRDAYGAEPTTFEIIGSSGRTIAMSAFEGGQVTFAITVRRITSVLQHVTSDGIDHPCFTRLSIVNRVHVFDSTGITSIPITYEPIGYVSAEDTLKLTDGVDTMEIVLQGRNLTAVPGLKLLLDTLDFGTVTMPANLFDSVGVVNVNQGPVTLMIDSASAPFATYLTESSIQPQDTVWIQVRCMGSGLVGGVYSNHVMVYGSTGVLTLTLLATLRDTSVGTTPTDSIRVDPPSVSVLIGESFHLNPVVVTPVQSATSVDIVYSYHASSLIPVNALSDKPDSLDTGQRSCSVRHQVTDGYIATSAEFRAALGRTAFPTITIREAVWRDSAGNIISANYSADTCFVTIRDALGVEIVHNSPTSIRIAPHPVDASTNRCVVEVKSPHGLMSMDIFAPHGTLMFSASVSQNIARIPIDTSKFPPGTYHVRVRSTHDVVTTMLAVIR